MGSPRECRTDGAGKGAGESATLRLDELGAARGARRWAAERVRAAGLPELSDDAEAVVGELVSNVVLHARLPAEVGLSVSGPRVRLEVRDASSKLPVRSVHGRQAITGRGLVVVESLAQAWGVEPQAGGKTIWVEIEDGATRPASASASEDPDELLEAWARWDDEAVAAPAGDHRYTVRLGDVPTDLLLSAKAHVDDLVREFTLASAGERTGATAEVPDHLAELLQAVVERFAEPRQMIKRQALAAANAGDDHVELELRLPLEAADAGEQYLEALEQADAYCRAARLLTLETPPRQRVFRRWYVEELIGQLRRAAQGQPSGRTQSFEERLLAEIDRVAEAERIAERSARLHALVAGLSEAVTPEAVADHALNEGAAAIGAAGGGLLLTGDRPTVDVPATIGYDESIVAGLRAESPDAELPAAYAARSGEAVWLESRRDCHAQFPGLAELEPATEAMCAVPLVIGERCLGALRFSFSRPRLFDAEERAFMWGLATQTAHALDRAVLSQQHAEASRRLQRNLLPQELPEIPGVDVATHYDAAEAIEVGGDFYDVMGAERRWFLVMGDVRGKGVAAAALTATARHTVRSGVLSGFDVCEILTLLNRAFLADHSEESFCTAVCADLTLHSDHASVTLASGGHPEPLVLRADGTVERVSCGGPLVGVFAEVAYETTTVRLYPGDLLLLYTDGITEARRDGEFFGQARFEQELAVVAGKPAEAVIGHLHAEVEAFQTGQRDDTAMLALRLPPVGLGATAPQAAARGDA